MSVRYNEIILWGKYAARGIQGHVVSEIQTEQVSEQR